MHLVFAESDDGLIYMKQVRRRVDHVCRHGLVTVNELSGVDHPMHLVLMRPRVARALSGALKDTDARV